MVVGFLGGGQLARMMAQAGYPLGLRFVFLDPAEDACAASLGEHICAPFDDPAALELLAEKADVVTYEFENVPAEAARILNEHVSVYPPTAALASTRERLHEKTLFTELGIPVAPFAAIDSLDELHSAVDQIGLPAVLKTRTLGYDGKGQVVLRGGESLDEVWASLGGVPLILEGFVAFQRELSVVTVRGKEGDTAFYPVAENTHRNGILHLSVCRRHDPQQQAAQGYAKQLLDHLDYVGVMAIEFFESNGELLANEMAPRVHNSGHWTTEGAETSQFENHMRAICGLPLGETHAIEHSAMINLIGSLPDSSAVLRQPCSHLHLYDKKPQPGRKLAHVTLRCESSEQLDQSVTDMTAVLGL
jgi:5-(carboxyamino)imidazole ribonucleotide synthase